MSFVGVPKYRRGEIWKFLIQQHMIRMPDTEDSFWKDQSYESLVEQPTGHQHAILIDLGESVISQIVVYIVNSYKVVWGQLQSLLFDRKPVTFSFSSKVVSWSISRKSAIWASINVATKSPYQFLWRSWYYYSRLSVIRLSLFRTFCYSNRFLGTVRIPGQILTEKTP